MSNNGQKVELRVDAYTRVCLTVIAVLLTVLIVGLWAEGVPNARPAMGAAPAVPPLAPGIPNAGQQREQLVRETANVAAKLDRLIHLFESGDAKVQVSEAGKDGPAKGGAAKEAEAKEPGAAKEPETNRAFIKRTD